MRIADRLLEGRWLTAPALWGPAVCVSGAVFLLVRIAPDVRGKPIYEDEALAGLISARPLAVVLPTVLADRGGAPLHFVLTHLAFLLDPSPTAMRWVSVVFALAVIPVCFDLARRVAGVVAGVTAAGLAATSSVLAFYGSFGRMYALFAFASTLAADLFVRALEKRTVPAATAAAGGAWLLPASHPYGAIVVIAEAVLAASLWRGRGLRAALPVFLVGLAMIPFALADVRLAERFSVGASARGTLATPEQVLRLLGLSFEGFSGGSRPVLALMGVLAVAGLVFLAHTQAAFTAFACLALAGPPILLLLGHGRGSAANLQARHLIYGLPLWVTFIGAGVAVLARRLPWLRARVESGDVLFPASPAFVAALPEAAAASPLTRGGSSVLLRSIDRAGLPVDSLFFAVPLDRSSIDRDALRALVGAKVEVGLFPSWLLLRVSGPFSTKQSVLRAAGQMLVAAEAATTRLSPELADFYENTRGALSGSLRRLSRDCESCAP